MEYFDSVVQGVIQAVTFLAIRKTFVDNKKTTRRPSKRKSGSQSKTKK